MSPIPTVQRTLHASFLLLAAGVLSVGTVRAQNTNPESRMHWGTGVHRIPNSALVTGDEKVDAMIQEFLKEANAQLSFNMEWYAYGHGAKLVGGVRIIDQQWEVHVGLAAGVVANYDRPHHFVLRIYHEERHKYARNIYVSWTVTDVETGARLSGDIAIGRVWFHEPGTLKPATTEDIGGYPRIRFRISDNPSGSSTTLNFNRTLYSGHVSDGRFYVTRTWNIPMSIRIPVSTTVPWSGSKHER